jgi:hypothetical protein
MPLRKRSQRGVGGNPSAARPESSQRRGDSASGPEIPPGSPDPPGPSFCRRKAQITLKTEKFRGFSPFPQAGEIKLQKGFDRIKDPI